MRFFELEPEGPAETGPSTIGDLQVRPPKIEKLEFQFNHFARDCIIEFVSIYVVTKALERQLIAAGATGISFGPVKITKTGVFEDLYPGKNPPKSFSWMKVTGRRGVDDFGLSQRGLLVASERVVKLMMALGLNHCEIVAYDGR